MTGRVLVLVATALVATAALAEEDAASLIARLRAPCCWNQTLDVHASPSADGLRDEIRKRAAQGESITAIEADVVKRYGERIRAVPTAGFLTPVGIFGLMGGVFILILTIAMGVRMTRKKDVASAPAAEPIRADSAEARALRAELEALD